MSKVIPLKDAPFDIEQALQDSQKAIHNEIKRILAKSKSGEALEFEEARALNDYVKSLVNIRRDDRMNRIGAEDVADMSDEELDDYMERIGYVKKKQGGAK